MTQLFSNFAKSVTVGALAVDGTVMTVASTQGGLFAAPAAGEFQTLVLTDGVNYEVIKVTGRVGDVFSVLRQQEDTAPRPWAEGTEVLAWNTKDTMKGFLQRSEYQPAVNIQNYRLFR